MSQAGDYSGVLHYLKAVKALGVDRAKASGRAVVAQMKAMPTDDDCFGAGSIRVDGRKIHPAYLFTVKSPRRAAVPATSTNWSRNCRPNRHSAPSPRVAVDWSGLKIFAAQAPSAWAASSSTPSAASPSLRRSSSR